LVEVSVNNDLPVCKIMDYGKFKYRQTKKAHEAKQKQKHIQIKEIKIRPQTDEGDYQTKLRKLINFLQEGDKTKITVRFRGREIQNQELGIKVLERIQNDLQEYSTIEHYPSMEGRQMIMILNPISRPTKGTKSSKPSNNILANQKNPSSTKEKEITKNN